MKEFFKRHRVLYISLAIFYILWTSWLADAIKGDDMFSYLWGNDFTKTGRLYIIAGLFLGIFVLIWLTKKLLSQDEPIDISDKLDRPITPHEVLVLHLSDATKGVIFDRLSYTVRWLDGSDTELAEVMLSGNIQEDVASLKHAQDIAAKPGGEPFYWNWLQLLRGLQPHLT